jgi:hypothetical protein
VIRDRIKELRRVRAGDIYANPRNWREHPRAQQDALRGVLKDVGYADALLARELPDGTLELVDGHLRKELDPNQVVPVLILDIDQDEANKLLTVLDPLAAMAETNKNALASLLMELQTQEPALLVLVDQLAASEGIDLMPGGLPAMPSAPGGLPAMPSAPGGLPAMPSAPGDGPVPEGDEYGGEVPDEDSGGDPQAGEGDARGRPHGRAGAVPYQRPRLLT